MQGNASTALSQAFARRLQSMPNGHLSAATFKGLAMEMMLALPVTGNGYRVAESMHGRIITKMGATTQGGAATSVGQGLAKLINELPDDSRAIVSARTCKRILHALATSLPIGGDGAQVTEGAHGRVISQSTAAQGGASTAVNDPLIRVISALPNDGSWVSTQLLRKLMNPMAKALPQGGAGARVSETPHGRKIDGEAAAGATCEVFMDLVLWFRYPEYPDDEMFYWRCGIDDPEEIPAACVEEPVVPLEYLEPSQVDGGMCIGCVDGAFNVFDGQGFGLRVYGCNIFPQHPTVDADFPSCGPYWLQVYHMTLEEYMDTREGLAEGDPEIFGTERSEPTLAPDCNLEGDDNMVEIDFGTMGVADAGYWGLVVWSETAFPVLYVAEVHIVDPVGPP